MMSVSLLVNMTLERVSCRLEKEIKENLYARRKVKEEEAKRKTQPDTYVLLSAAGENQGDNERNTGYPDRGWPSQVAWHMAQFHTRLAQE